MPGGPWRQDDTPAIDFVEAGLQTCLRAYLPYFPTCLPAYLPYPHRWLYPPQW